MVKRILGYFFFVLGGLFVFSLFGNFLRISDGNMDQHEIRSTVTSMIFIAVLCFVFFYFGYRWTKKKPEKIDVSDIGKE